MPTTITRPALEGSHPDPDRLRRVRNERTLRRVEQLEAFPSGLGLTFANALGTAKSQCRTDPTAQKLETWEAWVMATQIGSALFASAVAPPGRSISVVIGHAVRTIPAVGVTHFVDAGTWLDAFWLAVICRDQARMTQLSHVPVETLRASGAVYEAYVYHWVDALQTYWLERPGLGEELTAAFDGTDPERLRFVERELMLKVLYPPVELFFRFLSRDPVTFNEALARAVHLHKDYWTADVEERQETGAGDVALAPLALACLAYDAGWPVEVESEYLPLLLLNRAWVGEFPT
ncbi:immunity 49 family protein [Streptomyces longwoodensis]|uniref:immunity 49 family protein n=1 Tax=Streptomyces longwoodensis TaxID=68231 RepID=UPI0037FAA431